MASTASAEIIGGNNDLTVEILQLLPAKSLVRFKSVSKAWLSLISGVLWRSHHHPKVSGLFFHPRSGSETIKYIPLTHSDDWSNQCDIATVINGGEENNSPPLFMYARIMDSRNGLLLVYFTKLQSCSSDWRQSHHVYNPTTKQFSTLPWPFPDPCLGGNLYLVFDPLKSLDYKVVSVQATECGNPYLYQIHIYSSKTNDWRRSPLDDDMCGYIYPKPSNKLLNSVELNEGVYCNGSLHWISHQADRTSLYFDVNQNRLCPMPSPPYNAGSFKFWHFGESGGHLHYIRYYDDMGFNVNVWEMESDYSKWTTKYRVCLNATMVEEMEMVVCNCKDTAISLIHGVFLVLVVRTETNYIFISYNIKENTFKKRLVPRHPVTPPSWSNVLWCRNSCIHSYIETLFHV